MNWDALSIVSVTSYKSDHLQPKNNRCKVELDMPVEDYSDFRKTIQAHHILRNRRKDDPKES